MDWKKLGNRLLRAGAKEGVKLARKALEDPKTRQSVAGLLTGPARDTDKDTRGDTSSKPPRAAQQNTGRTTPAVTGREDYQSGRTAQRSAPKQGFPHRPSGGYPGDFTGTVKPQYAPDLDGDADPGEVVWAWVPFEEDPGQGKDRPVLIVGHDGRWLLGLMLSSKDHVPGGVGDIDETRNARWLNVGAGDWDAQRRPSEIRLDRIIRISPSGVRREGAILPMELYSLVAKNIE
ncbi:type II toxin-antitoxin system PemK/MazF family toxin [Brevibacterium sp. 50QC2O2]|uniref:type II toxin-antitoxin system PemK/MazF family toxin n=1 Tax=Brevibacterium TaxID=1696 RepID=UPI00211D0933|nr:MULTISPECIES: type II toxin-antitoxin system PemK/MazF family toxin [unclassified Brevibacterium]MCQ9366936.1 type II toxin-antitoxin system PemK/MazF family toxin [Brevibacterium sp. 91QC2O2]MCQ9384086.1 type II toxin-antitoxin system PemK/MazF family toxin [Brevibacterium sp. 68QC2CO]MCQ9388436.1 type II toxin-antitoxin system PemK/MazF family toxin [Brevibacterium sp. 50QC2O2]